MSLTAKAISDYLFVGPQNKTLFLEENDKKTSFDDLQKIADSKPFKKLNRKLVCCILDNRSESLVGYLALLCNNAVGLIAGSAISKQNLRILNQEYLPEYAWLPTERVPDFPGTKLLFSFGAFSLAYLQNNQKYAINNSLALLIPTSGSTGSPRYVRLSTENILSNTLAIGNYLELTPDEKPITTLPPNYAYGLSIIHSHLFCGAPVVLTNYTFFHREFWELFKTSEATSFGGVPYHFDILKKIKFSDMKLPYLKTVTQAGGRMIPEAAKEFASQCSKRNIRFFAMYGQAEATARMSFLPYQKAVEKAGSIGQAIPGGEFWIEDEEGKVVDGPEVAGELVYRGKNVSMGYAESFRELARGDDFGGVLRTGDLARRDADGDYHIIGRKKRFLKIFGHRMNLQDVEDFLSRSGYQAACAGRDDSLEVYAVKAGESEGKPIKEALVAELKVAPAAVRVFGIPELPRNEAGKIQYSQLTPSAAIALA